MTPREIEIRVHELRQGLIGTASRIRRYTLDSRLATSSRPQTDAKLDAAKLVQRLDAAWKSWLEVRKKLLALPDPPTKSQLEAVETAWLVLEREVDLVQRDLVSPKSTRYGVWTSALLAITLLISVYGYLVTHGMPDFDVQKFEPWPDWGPVKYMEVACWSFFGVLCYLLYTATYYVARRDFDSNFVPWYVSTALRAPLLVIILMLVVLEFVEWYGEGGKIEEFVLEEGNKYYFLVFMSFCLGISSEATSAVIGDLSEGVSTFVRNVSQKVCQWLGALVRPIPEPPK